MAQQSLVIARPSSVSINYDGQRHDITKFLDGDYASLRLTSGKVIKFTKGFNGNASGAMDMQATISSATFRIMKNDPFAQVLLKMFNSMVGADGASMGKLTVQDIQINFYFESDGEIVYDSFGADFGAVSEMPQIRANASGDATQNVFSFALEMPTGCRYKGRVTV